MTTSMESVLRAIKRSYQIAFETAVRTGTALVFSKNGKVIEVKPPFRYVLEPIESKKRKKTKKRSK